MATVIPAYMGPSHWPGGSFRPSGSLVWITDRPNPLAYEREGTIAARLFVGFSVGSVSTYTVDDLVTIVAREWPGSASIVAQKGIYVSDYDGSKTVEDGAQVVIVSTSPRKRLKGFTREIVKLGETICREFRQELVTVEIQRDGVIVKWLGIRP